jgi:hypothetical protein
LPLYHAVRVTGAIANVRHSRVDHLYIMSAAILKAGQVNVRLVQQREKITWTKSRARRVRNDCER